jgi:predicted transcriptional regulator
MSEVSEKIVKLTGQQQRVIKLLFKFRFVSALGLAQVMGISRPGSYQAVESLVSNGLVDKVYAEDYRIDRKPAYYYLNKTGVTTVRKLLDVKESAVNTLYQNAEATEEFIDHCLTVAACYVAILRFLPEGTDVFTRTEINRFKQFPKNRPDLYIRTPDGHEAVIIITDDKPPYIIRKRLDEIITHSEDEGWPHDTYPHICFVLKDTRTKNSLLYATHKRLDSMGMDEDELHILATSLKQLTGDFEHIWSNAFHPTKQIALFE